MKSIFKSIIITCLFVFSQQIVFAQDADKTVTITVSGSGKTLEDAKQAALRSSTEQAFGAFISSKTEMFNDQVVADQMASVSSGNIKSFEVLNESQLPDGRWNVTLKTIVSVDKLTSFVEAKGIAIEIKGGLFALNIKQQLLNEQGEIEVVSEMVGLLHEFMQISFDYSIKSGDPQSLDAQSKNWEIPLMVTSTCNKNIDFCANYFIKTINALALTRAEIESYRSLKKLMFPLSINYKEKVTVYYLRKQASISAINGLNSNWDFYTCLFKVQCGKDESYGDGQEEIFDFIKKRYYSPNTNDASATMNFMNSGQMASQFRWNDIRTLSQIEQMTGYSVKPIGVFSKFGHGGYIVYEKDGHGLVISVLDIGWHFWDSGKTACDELNLNGYDDWHLPNKFEWDSYIFRKIIQAHLGGVKIADYWSATEYSDDDAWFNQINNGSAYSKYDNKHSFKQVRAVRTF